MEASWISWPTPSAPGWQTASTERCPDARRYWSGRRWSAPAYEGDDQQYFDRARATRADTDGDVIEWLAPGAAPTERPTPCKRFSVGDAVRYEARAHTGTGSVLCTYRRKTGDWVVILCNEGTRLLKLRESQVFELTA
jgi:hypothetical protein